MNKHIFALYWQNLSQALIKKKSGEILTISDEEIRHRVHKILRLQENESLILFDRKAHIDAYIKKSSAQEIIIEVKEILANESLKPEITYLLPVLKREALEEAVYNITELGANTIQLITSTKIQKKSLTPHELKRLERIMISAAEQAKNYAFPIIHPTISLQEAIKKYAYAESKIFFDANGQNFWPLLSSLKSSKNFLLLSGPEADLTLEEKQELKNSSFTFTALTPTILRAQQACSIATGIIRSLLR